MPFDLVQPHLFDRERVLHGQIARDLRFGIVEMLMPGPERNPEQVAFPPDLRMYPGEAAVRCGDGLICPPPA